MNSVSFTFGSSNELQIVEHLRACDSAFVRNLSKRVDIDEYANKLFEKSERIEAWHETVLIGLIAFYCNQPNKLIAFITSVSVSPDWARKGIASNLLDRCLKHISNKNYSGCRYKN